ncbi:MurR/RpiR family transcriptional regulator [Paramaledivibacter caminithermalis]|uniref:Transcriptional regulator, RpiR family n=1 Tax=Paramaledivibacter caminithermalis (strain DSM 15212 / CIP 107654 / DViRD3) TaxID=1121301 RepID=A0A1M6P0F4_PARC5|nr:MurR/RpiR family transcriptional regulator [Paramaledivibacter caminithermalis]SHK01394.1 transcriptional regulator, RpiR family [Paramaledivibacter caminithermalis DSM 15212]
MTIIDNILNNIDKLSNKQKIIAEYLIKNSGKVGFMSLKDISQEINVSEVTILNFCKSIGINSFIQLKKSFQQLIEEQLYVPNEIKSSLQELDNLNDVYNNIIQIHKLNYDRALSNNNIQTFQEISDLISNSNRIYICGQGISKVIAEYLNNRLRLINIDSKIIEVGDLMEASIDFTRATAEDCFILISFPKYSQNIVNIAEYLNQNKLTYIAISDSDESPLAKNSKYSLKNYSESLVFHNFISSTICLIEILVVILSFNMKKKLMLHLDNLEKIQSLLSQDLNN